MPRIEEIKILELKRARKEVMPPFFQHQAEIRECEEVEAMIDETVDQSFPASDPPAWTSLARKSEQCKANAARAPKRRAA